MASYRTVILEAHDGARWRTLSQLPTFEDSKINQYLLWENPTLSPLPKKAADFPPIPEDCSEKVRDRLKGVAYPVATCLDLAAFRVGTKQVMKLHKGHSAQAMTEMRGAIAMAEVLADGNIPVRFIILLDY